MSICFTDARRFVDDMAQVDDDADDADDSFSDGEFDKWEEENLDSMHIMRAFMQVLIVLRYLACSCLAQSTGIQSRRCYRHRRS